MSDPGVSTQNFLRLLLGGMQRGTDVFQNRQTMQQQQAPDLMLTLQQMMQRKQMADREQQLREDSLQFSKEQASAERARQGNIDIYNMNKTWRDETNAKARWEKDYALRKEASDALAQQRKAQAEKLKAFDAEDYKAKVQKRIGLEFALKDIEKQEQVVDVDFYDNLKVPEKIKKDLYEPILGPDGNVKGYKFLPPELRRRKGELMKQYEGLVGIEDEAAKWMTNFEAGPFMDTTNEEDLLQYLPE